MRIIRDRATQQTDTLAEIPLGRNGALGRQAIGPTEMMLSSITIQHHHMLNEGGAP